MIAIGLSVLFAVGLPYIWMKKAGYNAKVDALQQQLSDALSSLSASEARRVESSHHRPSPQTEPARGLSTDEIEQLFTIAELSVSVFHQFNNILIGVLGNTWMALEGLDSESPQYKRLKTVEASTKEAATLCQQMLLFSVEDDAAESVELAPTVRSICDLVRVGMQEMLTVDLLMTDTIGSVTVRPSYLRHIVLRLLLLAKDSGALNAQVKVSRMRQLSFQGWLQGAPGVGDWAVLQVIDDGRGVHDTSSNGPSESRLSSVSSLMYESGGFCAFESAVGRGTTVTLCFPFLFGSLTEEITQSGDSHKLTSERTILVADDTELALKFTRRILKRAGYRVVTAIDGVEALQVLDDVQSTVDLVILDMTMPRMNGKQVMDEMRKRGWKQPVLIASGYSKSEVGIDEGHFLQKPFRPQELLERVGLIFDETAR